MTTGENVVVTMDNAQDIVTAWMAETYYADGTAESVIASFGGIGLDVQTVPNLGANRADFCDKLRYYYGACVNLRESKAVDPKLFNQAQVQGQRR